MKLGLSQSGWCSPTALSLALLLLLSIEFAITPGGASAEQSSHMIKGSVTQNQLIDRLETAGMKCVIHEGSSGKNTLVVDQVRPGSSAYYKGICTGDSIKNLDEKTGVLTIERANKVYQITIDKTGDDTQRLSMVSPKLDERKPTIPVLDVKPRDPNIPVVDVKDRNPPLLDVQQKEKEKDKTLSSIDIELIIDISGSMEDPDGTGNLSKFEWCHQQVRELAQRLAPYKRTMTITTFNRSFDTMERCDPAKVENIYATTHPIGGTDLVDPLDARLNAAYMKQAGTKQPVVIAVITDGQPNIPRDKTVVNRALIDFSKRLTSPEQVMVTFLQIGDNFDGRDFCIDLDDNLVSEGAKYDIVDTKTFAELKQEGIVNALIDAIMEKHGTGTARSKVFKHMLVTPTKSGAEAAAAARQADQTLKSSDDERHEIEKRLLGQ
jgi:hypothetical protein